MAVHLIMHMVVYGIGWLGEGERIWYVPEKNETKEKILLESVTTL